MKRKGRLGVFGSICLVLAVTISFVLLVYVSLASAADEAYPSKPIRLIIGGKAGDAYDINGRRFAPTLAKKWGVNVTASRPTGARCRPISLIPFMRQAAMDTPRLWRSGSSTVPHHQDRTTQV